jgi:hypothetical protein
MKFYLIFVWGDVEPELMGPFSSPDARDDEARILREQEGDEHGIFTLTIDDDKPHPEIGTYSGGFFDE